MNIEERLSIELKNAARIPLPGRPLGWRSTLARGRRRRASYVVGAAAGTVAVCAAIIAGGFALGGQDPPLPRPAAPDTKVTPIESATIKWIDAIEAEHYRTSWRMLGPSSRGVFGSFEAFESVASGDYRGAWGRWAENDFDHYQTPVGSPGEGSVVAGTLIGEVEQEASPPALDTASLIVRVTGDGVSIEPAVAQYPIDLLAPRSPQPVDSAVVAEPVPADVVFRAEVTKSTAVVFDVVDVPEFQGPGRFDNRDPAGPRVARWNPPAPLPPGEHILTVVSTTAQGPIDTISVIFTAD